MLAAVFCNVIPIYSAIDMNLFPKIDNSIGSSGTSVILTYSLQFFYYWKSCKSISRLPNSSIKQIHLGSTKTVEVEFRMIAGPEIFVPAFNCSKSNTLVWYDTAFPST